MNRLIKSSKFWLAVIGSLLAVISYKFTDQINLSYWIMGAFIGGSVGTTAEDMISKSIGGGGIARPKK